MSFGNTGMDRIGPVSRGEPYHVPIRPLQAQPARWVGWVAVLNIVAFVGAVLGIARCAG
jgi:hypothetical protein